MLYLPAGWHLIDGKIRVKIDWDLDTVEQRLYIWLDATEPAYIIRRPINDHP